MSSLRPYSSNIFKNKSNKKKIPLIKALSDIYSPKINNTFSKTLSKTPTPLRFLKEKSNIFAKSNENLDLLNLIIKSSPNQYNQKKINEEDFTEPKEEKMLINKQNEESNKFEEKQKIIKKN